MVRSRFLGPRRVHDADDDDHHQRIRARHSAAHLQTDRSNGRNPKERKKRGGIRRIVFHAVLPSLVELQPDIQRAPGARGRTSSSRRRLSRNWSGRLSGCGQRLGLGIVFFGGAAHGRSCFFASIDFANQRRHSVVTDFGIDSYEQRFNQDKLSSL